MRKPIILLIIGISVLIFSTNIFSQITSKKSGNWNASSTWNGGSIPSFSDQVVISDGHTVTITSNAFCRNLTIGQGGAGSSILLFDNFTRTLNVFGTTAGDILISSNGVLSSTSGISQTISLTGDFTNNGIFNQGANNTVNFNGSALHGIFGNNITFNNLTINNSGGIFLSTNATVNNSLTLTSGLLYTTSDTLTVNGDINVTSPSFSKMIVLDDGVFTGRLKLKTQTNKSYLFPVGDTRSTDEYSPISINLTSGANASAYISVNLKNQKDANNLSIANYINRAWTVFPSALTSFTYDISLNYLNADVVGTESQLYFAKFDSGIWSLLGQPNTTTNIYSTTGLTSFSTFTGGEAGLLPVNLQSLNSIVSGRNVLINWVTVVENNNMGFEIMRTTVNKIGIEGTYEIAGFVRGSGTTNQLKSYSFSDKNLNTGRYKYKLKQIDNNGNFEFFSLDNYIEVGVPVKFSVSQNYPNPFNPTTKIDFEIPSDGIISLAIYDITGRETAKILNNEFRTAGYYTVEFRAGQLSSGIYFYRLKAGDISVTKKMALLK